MTVYNNYGHVDSSDTPETTEDWLRLIKSDSNEYPEVFSNKTKTKLIMSSFYWFSDLN